MRTSDLQWFGCQSKLTRSTCITAEIAESALELFKLRYAWALPLRSIGVNCSSLTPFDAPEQLDIFGEHERRAKVETLDKTVDDIRRRFGHHIIQRGVVLRDMRFASVNPRDEHEIHPIAFMKNGSEILRAR